MPQKGGTISGQATPRPCGPPATKSISRITFLAAGLAFAVPFVGFVPSPQLLAQQPEPDSVVPGAPSTTASLGGVLIDEKGDPLPGVVIRIVGTLSRTTTDEAGRFLFYELVPGVRVIQLVYRGQDAEPRSVSLIAGRHAEVEIELDRSGFAPERLAEDDGPDRSEVIPLDDLEVDVEGVPRLGKLAGFHQRRLDGTGGFYLTRAEILEKNPSRASDLFRSIPGVRVHHSTRTRNSLQTTRGRRNIHLACRLVYFLDGLEVPGFDVNDIPPRDLAGVEIYRSLSEIPPEFRRREQCSAILLWTRDPSIPDPEG